MLPFLILAQLTTADPAPNELPPPPPPPAYRPPPGYPPPPGAYLPPPGYAPAPPYYPGYLPPPPPGYAYGPPPPAAERAPEPPKAKEERPTRWFARVDFGLGPPGYSQETDALGLEGYGGTKVWGILDGAYMLNPYVGLGTFGGFAYRTSSPTYAPTLTENTYFVGAQVPIRLGTRTIACILAPRLGYATGRIEVLGDTPFVSTVAYGGDASLTFFRAHLELTIGYLRALTDTGGRVGRPNDFGGLHFMLGATFDG